MKHLLLFFRLSTTSIGLAEQDAAKATQAEQPAAAPFFGIKLIDMLLTAICLT